MDGMSMDKNKKSGSGMKSMARKSMGMEVGKSSKPSYPSIRIEEKTMPGLKGKTVGDKISMKMNGVITSCSKYGDGDTEYSIDMQEGMMEDHKK